MFRFETVLFILQYCGINAIVREHQWSKRRKFRIERAENFQVIENTETRSIHAESASSIIRHATHNG